MYNDNNYIVIYSFNTGAIKVLVKISHCCIPPYWFWFICWNNWHFHFLGKTVLSWFPELVKHHREFRFTCYMWNRPLAPECHHNSVKVWEYCYIWSVEQGAACTVCLLSIIKSHTFGNKHFKYINISKIKIKNSSWMSISSLQTSRTCIVKEQNVKGLLSVV